MNEYVRKSITRIFSLLGCLLGLLGNSLMVQAQCSDWFISAQVVTSSTCAANGSFEVVVSGPDAGNLTDLQYAVPATGTYAVPLNNSPIFTSVPGGTWPVSAVAICNGNFVGKNTNITMPGDYQPPTMQLAVGRNTLHCGAFGRITVTIHQGMPPFTVNLMSTPNGYTGSTSFTTTGQSYTIRDLPEGNYIIQVIDACNSGTAPRSITMGLLNSNNLPLMHNSSFGKTNCDLLIVPKPTISHAGGWSGYPDTFYRVAAEIDGGVAPPSSLEMMHSGSFSFPLFSGMSIKDCYGKRVRYTIRPVCGPDFYTTRTIPYPSMSYAIDQNCNIDFRAVLRFDGLICFPVTYTIADQNNITHGPFTTASTTDTTPSLPLGVYNVHFTTADGYNGGGNFRADSVFGTPYGVELIFRSAGLHNYADGFRISTTHPSVEPRTVELFSGPPGYAYYDSHVWGNTYINIWDNQAQTVTTTKFPPGNYIWKITDNCGTYLLPINVTTDMLYQFTVGIDSTAQTCNGLYLKPKGTITHGGQSLGVRYMLLRQDLNSWLGMPERVGLSDDAFLITQPGQYILLSYIHPWTNLITGGYFNLFPIEFPNMYTASDTFTYNIYPLQADMDRSQGFICSGIAGQAEVHVQGKNGIPFAGGHYQYYLARSGNGRTGPYIAQNTTGIFTGFGGNSGEVYEVKIEDSCGTFVVQPFDILDLRHARLIASSAYVACDSARVQLVALYLPGASYSWTGPNGFTSTQRTPVIEKIDPRHIGVYTVHITIPQCSQPISDTTIITSNVKPVEPLVQLNCGPPRTIMEVINPQPGNIYRWEHTLRIGSWYDIWIYDSDSSYYKTATLGTFRAIAIDTTTMCMSYSDTLDFPSEPNIPPDLRIYTAHTDICPDDSTTLLAIFSSVIPGNVPATFQWFFNGNPIPGAISHTLVTDQPGDYQVTVVLDSCQKDTSATVTVRNIPLPSVSLQASDTAVCRGNTAVLQAATGTGYSYTWNHNGTTIPGATTATLSVTQSGEYYVTVGNTGCAVISDTINVILYDPPIANLSPASNQRICNVDSILFSTPAHPSYSYNWYKDGVLLPLNNTSQLLAKADGAYSVVVSTPSPACPDAISDTVQVFVDTMPNALITFPTRDACTGDTIMLETGTGTGFAYQWYQDGIAIPGSNNHRLAATQTGTYSVQITNGVCVQLSDTVALRIHPNPIVQLTPNTPQRICEGDTVRFSTHFDPDYTYTWLRNGTTLTNTTTNTLNTHLEGNYTVIVARAYCQPAHGDTIQVDVVPPPIADIQITSTDICAGDTVRIYATAGSGYTYTWYRDGVIIPGILSSLQPNISGSYHVVVSNGACSRVSNVLSLNVHQRPTAQIQPASNQYLCTGSSIVLSTASGAGYNYIWYRDGAEIVGAQSNQYTATDGGSYRVRVSSPFCPEAWSDSVLITLLPTEVALGNDTIICSPGAFAIPLAISDGFDSYLWSNGSTTASTTATYGGTWWVRAENHCGVFIDSVSIHTTLDYHPTLPDDTVICNEANNLQLSVPSSLQQILWSNGATSHTIVLTQPGTYWVQGQSPCGILTDTIQVSFCPPQIHQLILPDTLICAGGCINLASYTGNFPQQFDWDLPGGSPAYISGSSTIRVCYDQPGTFPVTLTVSNAGGTESKSGSITVLPFPSARFQDTTLTVSYKADLILAACSDAQTADWYLGDSLVCRHCPTLAIQPKLWQQTYHCVVRNADCIDTCIYDVRTRDIPSDITVPTAFSPNDDGKNDYFRIVTGNPNIVIKEFTVFNRWGNRVYSGTDMKGWDGRFGGQPAENGTYFWHLRYGLINSDETWTRKGDVTLVR